jgi:hypothetical protein
MIRTSAILCITAALGLFDTGAASAEKWTMLEEQEVSINYGNDPLEALLSVTCSGRQSEIYVTTAPGTKPPADAPVLVVKEGAATNTIKVEAYVCGWPTACMHRPDGEVPTYFARSKGKAVALRFAEKMTSAEIDAPGAKLSVGRDAATFRKFAAACRKWK